jgi:membrane fusion protein (multidrug efflux system)
MNLRKLLYPAVAATGIIGLGAYAYVAQRVPQAPVEKASGVAPTTDRKSGPSIPGNPVSVEVATVIGMRLRDELNAAGAIQSNESVMLRPEVAGRITRLNFADGQTVRKGQVLVALDAAVNQAEVQQAKAELSIAQANLKRNTELAQQKFIAQRVKEESAVNVQVLEAKLALAQARLSKFEIKAPFSGIVGIRNVSIGDYVKDGADLVNLEDISSVKVDFRVPERFIDRVRNGQAIDVMVDALPGQQFRAKVDAIDPQIDNSGRSALLRGRIANPENRLKPGMFARVTLILDERENARVIPEEAIVPMGNTSTVWKIIDEKAYRTEVKTGLRRDAKVEIVDGLQIGDTVVTAGQVRLSKDGTPIRLVQDAASNRSGQQPGAAGTAVNQAGAVNLSKS